MGKLKPQEDITQWCLKSHFFDEVMKLPKEVKIEKIRFELGSTMKKHSLPIPPNLKKLGVSYMRESHPSFEVEGTFEFPKRADYEKAADELCTEVNMKRNTLRVKRLVLSVKGNRGVFARTSKTIKGEEKSERKTVLGMFEWEGNANEIAKALSAGKFACKFEKHTVTSVFCEELS